MNHQQPSLLRSPEPTIVACAVVLAIAVATRPGLSQEPPDEPLDPDTPTAPDEPTAPEEPTAPDEPTAPEEPPPDEPAPEEPPAEEPSAEDPYGKPYSPELPTQEPYRVEDLPPPAPVAPPPAPGPTPRTAPPPAAAPPPPASRAYPAPSQRPVQAQPPATASHRDQLPPGDEQKEDEDDGDGIFGPFRIGPVIGAGVPNLLSFGGAIKLTRYLGAGLNIGIIPEAQLSLYGEATLSYQEYDIYGRIYPFGGAFFLGAGVGYATVSGTFSNTYAVPDFGAAISGVGDVELTSEASVRSMVLTPQMGWFKTWGSGFSLGIDFGAQVPIAPSEIEFSTRVPTQLPPAVQPVVDGFLQQNDQEVRDTLEAIGQTVIPTVNIRMGWLL